MVAVDATSEVWAGATAAAVVVVEAVVEPVEAVVVALSGVLVTGRGEEGVRDRGAEVVSTCGVTGEGEEVGATVGAVTRLEARVGADDGCVLAVDGRSFLVMVAVAAPWAEAAEGDALASAGGNVASRSR